MKALQAAFERGLFASRWLLAPIAAGLAASLLVLLALFVRKLAGLVSIVLGADPTTGDIIVGVLSLVDVSLLGNLVLMVIFSGYETFVSRIETAGAERPEWMGQVGFGDLKLKLMASIVAISGIQVLEVFMQVHEISNRDLGWTVGLHMAFVVSALLLALMDRITGSH